MRINKEALQLWKNVVQKTLEECKVSAQVSWDTSEKNATPRFLAILRVGKYAETVVSDPFSPIEWRLQIEDAINKIALRMLQDHSNESIRR